MWMRFYKIKFFSFSRMYTVTQDILHEYHFVVVGNEYDTIEY
jgi:hypothetical protein